MVGALVKLYSALFARLLSPSSSSLGNSTREIFESTRCWPGRLTVFLPRYLKKGA